MPQFAANLTMLFNELPFVDRFAAAKAAGDHLVRSFFATYGLDVVITRGSNTYGPKSARIETIGDVLRIVLGGGVAAPQLSERVADMERRDGELARRFASLTPQQLKVLVMLAEGESNKSIGSNLSITEATVKAHITAILRKLQLERRTQVAILAQRLLQTGAHSGVDGLDEEA